MFLQILPPDSSSFVEEIVNNKLLLFFLVALAIMIPFFIKSRKSQSVKNITIRKNNS